jgi:hypothetical protein
LRAQVAEVEASATEIIERVRKQSARIDEMFSGVLDSVDRAGDYVSETLGKPVRQIAGVVDALKAIVESLRTPPPEPYESPTSRDRDTFV